MDKKKTLGRIIMTVALAITTTTAAMAQTVDRLQFCSYGYTENSDTIALYFNIIGSDGEHIKNANLDALNEHLQFFEDGKLIKGVAQPANGAFRIPREQTISVVVDRGIDTNEKEKIFQTLRQLVNGAPDSCIYLSFFDSDVTPAKMVTRRNLEEHHDDFKQSASGETRLYPALYHKLREFNSKDDYHEYNPLIASRAKNNKTRNAMFVFLNGNATGDYGGNNMRSSHVLNEIENSEIKPNIYAFYFVLSGKLDENLEEALGLYTGTNNSIVPRGKYVHSDNREEIFEQVGQVIENQKYDYEFIYTATHPYSGDVEFEAKLDDAPIGKETFTIGSKEHPWEPRKSNESPSAADYILKSLMALLAAFLTFSIFFCIMKVIIPLIKGKSFQMKYYKKYEPEYGITKRICTYCKQPIMPGQPVVAKCEHIMHVHCWEENDYRCAEYGQNCKTGIQEHVCWDELFTKSSFRDCQQAISGICAGFLSWIVYELVGRGIGKGNVAPWIVENFFTDAHPGTQFFETVSDKVASFLAIGLLLGFFLSLVFRYNEEYRKKNFSIYMKILGLSLLSALIGWAAFAVGAIMLCMMLEAGTFVIPWYASVPAYLLFSVCTALGLTIKTSIPIKSAMLGGLCSAAIGFIVLYFSNTASTSHPWMNMLLDLIIYGGGLGASLATVRILAEKYFLVIQNGAKAGTRIPIHNWMNATGGGNKVTIGMTNDCEIQMNWEKSNRVAKEHAVLFIDQNKQLPMIKPLQTGVVYNSRAELTPRRPSPLVNGDTFQIGETIFLYEETE